MGHLINKVLKDMVVKFRTMEGMDSPYVPGWDCHGLPIESAIQKELGPKFRELTKEEVRKRCAVYAMKYVKLQGDSFQRLGVFGDFARPYLTMDKRYEGGILDVLAELVKPAEIIFRNDATIRRLEGLTLEVSTVSGRSWEPRWMNIDGFDYWLTQNGN